VFGALVVGFLLGGALVASRREEPEVGEREFTVAQFEALSVLVEGSLALATDGVGEAIRDAEDGADVALARGAAAPWLEQLATVEDQLRSLRVGPGLSGARHAAMATAQALRTCAASLEAAADEPALTPSVTAAVLSLHEGAQGLLETTRTQLAAVEPLTTTTLPAASRPPADSRVWSPMLLAATAGGREAAGGSE
jgi:hypothetical protein